MHKILKINKLILISTIIFVFYFIFPRETFAHCPLCVAGAGAGLTLSRLLGVDDSITGIWIGAFIVALAFWFEKSISQRYKIIQKKLVSILIHIVFIALTIWSFYKFNLVVRHGDIFGIDKLTFGILIGAATFYLADIINQLLKIKFQKRLFPYQSIVISIGGVAISSLLVFILINYFI